MRAGVITVSDKGSIGERVDTAGPAVVKLLTANGIEVSETAMIADERAEIAALLRRWSDETGLDLILTAGGTGLAPRDVTPEATQDVAERQVPGFAEVMRAESRKKTPLADVSRAVVVTRGRTLIINLPGSERGAVENLEAILPILPHAVEVASGNQSH
ncbi:MAG: molybdenum cofactor biosynthesis protein [Dehalococcoidia bacterium]|nr:molybdenum cofactor biosynthesis protein [Dehalococcoidia bacterium]